MRIALTPTSGLPRVMPVRDTGGPLQVPIGETLPGRMLNVLGDTIDRGDAVANVEQPAM